LNLKSLFNCTTIADKVLFYLLILLSLSGIIFIKQVIPASRTVSIEVDGRPVYILPIDKNTIVSVDGPEGKTFVEIKDRAVRITESPCRNKLCVHQGWIKKGSIVCLPNRVIVTTGNQENNKTVDATSG
jgi:hypothetical protein